jgi:hypothetical protein
MKLADKAILGMVSESPGRNVSEPTGGLVIILKFRGPSQLGVGEGNRMCRRLTDETYPSGGVVGTAR